MTLGRCPLSIFCSRGTPLSYGLKDLSAENGSSYSHNPASTGLVVPSSLNSGKKNTACIDHTRGIRPGGAAFQRRNRRCTPKPCNLDPQPWPQNLKPSPHGLIPCPAGLITEKPLSCEFGKCKTVKPDSGLGFQAEVLKACEMFPIRSAAGCCHARVFEGVAKSRFPLQAGLP